MANSPLVAIGDRVAHRGYSAWTQGHLYIAVFHMTYYETVIALKWNYRSKNNYREYRMLHNIQVLTIEFWKVCVTSKTVTHEHEMKIHLPTTSSTSWANLEYNQNTLW
jgi:hypothetical protein